MSSDARLVPVSTPRRPEAVALVLHGGAARRDRSMVSPAQLSVLRMIPIARRVARAGGDRIAVYRLLNSHRGWDERHTPVDDARWALEQVADRHGAGLPAALVGHSLGGRAAILTGAHPAVRSVVALAPWVYPSDGDTDLGGRRVLVVHGGQDRIADPERAEQAARRLARTADVGFVRVEEGSHAMLRHHRLFDRYAAEFTAATLLGSPVHGVVGRVLAGERWLAV